MRYNYITVEAQWVGSMGTRAYGELITAELWIIEREGSDIER